MVTHTLDTAEELAQLGLDMKKRPAEWRLAMRIVVSDGSYANTEKFVQKSQKRHQVRSITELCI